jgi:hypothetical protein
MTQRKKQPAMKPSLMATVIVILVLGTLAFTACGGKPKFEVTSLTITPNEVMVSEKVTISVDVANVGSKEGTYQGTLIIDGGKVGTKSITVPGGGKEKLTFTVVPPLGGLHNVSVEGLKGVLAVKEGLELGYDDGRPDEVSGIRILGPGNGYLVKFSPPATPFTITKIKIYGSLYGEISPVLKFQVQIWDKNQVIINDTTYSYTEFSQTPAWAELAVANVRVSGDFYIHVCTNSTENSGIQIFYDSSVVNEHSEVTKNWQIAENWYLEQPKEKVNWMIRVDGTIIGTIKKSSSEQTTP